MVFDIALKFVFKSLLNVTANVDIENQKLNHNFDVPLPSMLTIIYHLINA